MTTPAIGPDFRAEVVQILRSQPGPSVALHDVRPGDLYPRLRERSIDLGLASVSGVAGDALARAELRPQQMDVFVPVRHRLAGSRTVRLEQFDGARLLTAGPAGSPFTDLLVGRFAQAGAVVTPVEARVTGGAQMLTELVAAQAIAVEPAGTQPPRGVGRLTVEDLTLPVRVLWLSGRVPPAVRQLRRALGDRP